MRHPWTGYNRGNVGGNEALLADGICERLAILSNGGVVNPENRTSRFPDELQRKALDKDDGEEDEKDDENLRARVEWNNLMGSNETCHVSGSSPRLVMSGITSAAFSHIAQPQIGNMNNSNSGFMFGYYGVLYITVSVEWKYEAVIRQIHL